VQCHHAIDVRNSQAVANAFIGCEAVYHLGGATGGGYSEESSRQLGCSGLRNDERPGGRARGQGREVHPR
jgi:hypothetical protein